jgi:hypothetical protein
MAKVKETPAGDEIVEVVAEPEKVSPMTVEDEAAAMKQQVLYQFKQLLKMAETMGIKLEEIYEKPPVDVTKVVASAIPAPATEAGKLKPGTVLGTGVNASWVPWTKADLDPDDVVEFSPLPLPGIVYPFPDENGYQKIRLDINGLVVWFTCGVPNIVNRYFYNEYQDKLANWRALEDFKRNGPSYAPWGRKGPDGQNAWMYVPMAPSFGMNEDGRSLRPGGPTPLDPTSTIPSAVEVVVPPPAVTETK